MPLASNCAQQRPNTSGPHADLSRMYLAHHDLENITITVVAVLVIIVQPVPACVTSTSTKNNC